MRSTSRIRPATTLTAIQSGSTQRPIPPKRRDEGPLVREIGIAPPPPWLVVPACKTTHGVTYQLLQRWRRRIRRVAVLTKALGVGDAEVAAPPLGPAHHRARVVVDTVLAREPRHLALMRGQHAPLGFEEIADIDAEVGPDPLALATTSADGVHEVEVRDRRQRSGRAGAI